LSATLGVWLRISRGAAMPAATIVQSVGILVYLYCCFRLNCILSLGFFLLIIIIIIIIIIKSAGAFKAERLIKTRRIIFTNKCHNKINYEASRGAYINPYKYT
jgi:hypothetical protein